MANNDNAEETSWESFRITGKRMVDEIADYYTALGSSAPPPVRAQVTPGYLAKLLPSSAPEIPDSFEAVLQDVHTLILPGVTHWQHPSFFAYFPANSSPPAILGDMLSDALGVVSFSWVASPAATELESIVTDWLAKLMGLPDTFASSGTGGGVIQGSASEATLVALLAAKSRTLRWGVEAGMPIDSSRLVAYGSDQSHSSLIKACNIAGLAPGALRLLRTTQHDNWALSPNSLTDAIEADVAAGLTPFFVCATFGTTGSGACDPVADLSSVLRRHEESRPSPHVWLHVDAAWAGSALVCPEFRHLARGAADLGVADSFDFNPHKWLLTNFDCSCLFVTQRKWLFSALSITPEYLRSAEHDGGFVTDFRDWQLPLGRRFRSLKLWFVLRMFGAEALRGHIRRGVACAGVFVELLSTDARFVLAAPPCLGLVVFRLLGGDALNAALLESLNASGRLFLVHTKLGGAVVLRLAVGGALTTEEHVREAWTRISAGATAVIAEAAAQSTTPLL